jgi:cystathionine beta-synthase
VTFVCDTGNKYLSKAFNDAWLTDHGLVRSKETGDLRDFIGRSHERGDVLSVGAEDSLAFAHSRMRLGDVSQLPVLEDNKIVGLVDESDLLVSVAEDPAGFSKPVRSVMSDRLETVDVSTPYRELLPIFERGLVAIVVRRGDFLGLITRYDLLNTLRRRVSG